MSWFLSPKSLIGLDLSDSSAEAVQFSFRGKEFFLDAFSRKMLAPGVIGKGEIQDEDELKQFLETLFSESLKGAFTARRIAFAIPPTKVFHAVMDIDLGVRGEDFDAFLPNQFKSLIPFELSEIYWAWELIAKDEVSQKILIVASPKPTIDSYFTVFSGFGLTPTLFEPLPFSLARLLTIDAALKKDDFGVLDIGTDVSVLAVFFGGHFWSSYTIPFGGMHLTHALASKLDISQKDAEILKRKHGLDHQAMEGRICLILQKELQNFLEQIRKILVSSEFASETKGRRIFVTGGGSQLPSLFDYMASNIEHVSVKPFSLPAPLSAFFSGEKERVLFSTALGLGISEQRHFSKVNFLSHRNHATEERWSWKNIFPFLRHTY
ncbi:MAG: pilus assembly protein PilM [Parcubacteria group bacterium]|nr:pilus assembly protein PilM [Parcubacteria group bacterium]